MDNPEQAVRRFETLFEDRGIARPDFPRAPEPEHDYATAHSKLGEYEEALEYYQAGGDQPKNSQAWYHKSVEEL